MFRVRALVVMDICLLVRRLVFHVICIWSIFLCTLSFYQPKLRRLCHRLWCATMYKGLKTFNCKLPCVPLLIKEDSFTRALKTGHSFEESSSSRGKTAVTMPELPRSIKTIFNRTHLLSSSQAHFIESSKKAHVVCKIIQLPLTKFFSAKAGDTHSCGNRQRKSTWKLS